MLDISMFCYCADTLPLGLMLQQEVDTTHKTYRSVAFLHISLSSYSHEGETTAYATQPLP